MILKSAWLEKRSALRYNHSDGQKRFNIGTRIEARYKQKSKTVKTERIKKHIDADILLKKERVNMSGKETFGVELAKLVLRLDAIGSYQKSDSIYHYTSPQGAGTVNEKLKKTAVRLIPYLLVALAATCLGKAWRMAEDADATQTLLNLPKTLEAAVSPPIPSLHPIDLLTGTVMAALLRAAVYLKGKNARKYRKNREYGSARWGTREDIAPYIDPVFQKNVILTQTERLTMNNRPRDPQTARNKNVLVVGGSGSGKTRFFIKPNLMQCHSSYVVTDPKGSVVVECGRLLQRKGYRIKILNTINFRKSHHYNPFAYIHSEKDILKLVSCLMANTKGEGKSGDDFWQKAEVLLYTALIGFIHYELPPEERNFATLIEMISSMEIREDNEDFQNNVDLEFEELAKRKPDHFAVRQYAKYKLAAGDVCSK